MYRGSSNYNERAPGPKALPDANFHVVINHVAVDLQILQKFALPKSFCSFVTDLIIYKIEIVDDV